MSDIKAIPTRYAGCHFRSRLEARWAVFFDVAEVRWEYEPQGFVLNGTPGLADETPYLPDFLLVDCGTWVEVKGNPDELNPALMEAAAQQLPRMPHAHEAGPKLLVLGPHPRETSKGDWGWMGLDIDEDISDTAGPVIYDAWYGFGSYCKNLRPWQLVNTSCAPPFSSGEPPSAWIVPVLDPYEPQGQPVGYAAARSARFEHGQSGAT